MSVQSCWIMNKTGLTLFSHSKSKIIDEQLFGGVLSAIITLAQTLGTDIHQVDFDSDSLITFPLDKLRVALMLKKPVSDMEVNELYQNFDELKSKYEKLVSFEHNDDLMNTEFAHDIIEICEFEDKKEHSIENQVKTILKAYETNQMNKKEAAQELLNLHTEKDTLSKEDVQKRVVLLKTLITNIGLTVNYQDTFSQLIDEYGTRLEKAVSKLKYALFR